MKKLILTLGLLCFVQSTTFADCPYMDKAPAKPYPVSGSASHIVQKITGMNWFSKTVAQSIIKKEAKKATGEKFKVKLTPFSATDLMEGKFQSKY